MKRTTIKEEEQQGQQIPQLQQQQQQEPPQKKQERECIIVGDRTFPAPNIVKNVVSLLGQPSGWLQAVTSGISFDEVSVIHAGNYVFVPSQQQTQPNLDSTNPSQSNPQQFSQQQLFSDSDFRNSPNESIPTSHLLQNTIKLAQSSSSTQTASCFQRPSISITENNASPSTNSNNANTTTTNSNANATTATVLNPEAFVVFEEWLGKNLDNPFPTLEQKLDWIQKFSITERQIDKWFQHSRLHLLSLKEDGTWYLKHETMKCHPVLVQSASLEQQLSNSSNASKTEFPVIQIPPTPTTPEEQAQIAKAVEILETWLGRHIGNPVISPEQVIELSKQTGLNEKQVGDWIVNAIKELLMFIAGKWLLTGKAKSNHTALVKAAEETAEISAKSEASSNQSTSTTTTETTSQIVQKHILSSVGQNFFQDPTLPRPQKILPFKEAIEILENWLGKHLECPYLSQKQKSSLSLQTGMSEDQVKVWLTEARDRLLMKNKNGKWIIIEQAIQTHPHLAQYSELRNLQLNQQQQQQQQQQYSTEQSAPTLILANSRQEPEDILDAWLGNHLHFPYPTKEEKAQLGKETGFTETQIYSWFCNARQTFLAQQDDGKWVLTFKARRSHPNLVRIAEENQVKAEQHNQAQQQLNLAPVIISEQNISLPLPIQTTKTEFPPQTQQIPQISGDETLAIGQHSSNNFLPSLPSLLQSFTVSENTEQKQHQEEEEKQEQEQQQAQEVQTMPSATQAEIQRIKNVEILDTWLGHHLNNPYPTKDELAMLSKQTGLSQKQIAGWYSNSRRNLLTQISENKWVLTEKGKWGWDLIPNLRITHPTLVDIAEKLASKPSPEQPSTTTTTTLLPTLEQQTKRVSHKRVSTKPKETTPKAKRVSKSQFSKEVNVLFESWLGRNLDNPFPTQEQRIELAKQSCLTEKQINGWFTNARKLYLVEEKDNKWSITETARRNHPILAKVADETRLNRINSTINPNLFATSSTTTTKPFSFFQFNSMSAFESNQQQQQLPSPTIEPIILQTANTTQIMQPPLTSFLPLPLNGERKCKI